MITQVVRLEGAGKHPFNRNKAANREARRTGGVMGPPDDKLNAVKSAMEQGQMRMAAAESRLTVAERRLAHYSAEIRAHEAAIRERGPLLSERNKLLEEGLSYWTERVLADVERHLARCSAEIPAHEVAIRSLEIKRGNALRERDRLLEEWHLLRAEMQRLVQRERRGYPLAHSRTDTREPGMINDPEMAYDND